MARKPIEPVDPRQAMIALAKVCHSDINGGNDQAMKEINANYGKVKAFEDNTTHLAFILDDSGSMEFKKLQVISAYNMLLLRQTSPRSKATFSLDTFHEHSGVLPITQAKKLTRGDYNPRGGTPLYDTIGGTILTIDRCLGDPHDVIVVIITDGRELSSRTWTADSLRELIKDKIAMGWQFIYISCAGDYLSHGERIGIPAETITTFTNLESMFSQVSTLLTSYRSGEIRQITFKE
jgi:hypothetical protein